MCSIKACSASGELSAGSTAPVAVLTLGRRSFSGGAAGAGAVGVGTTGRGVYVAGGLRGTCLRVVEPGGACGLGGEPPEGEPPGLNGFKGVTGGTVGGANRAIRAISDSINLETVSFRSIA